MIDGLGIIIVTYNPDEKDFIGNINEYIDSSNNIVVVDNSKNPYVGESLIKYSNIEYICAGDNLGIAKAQNIGIEYLISQKVKYLLFFDQDSYLSTEQINSLMKSIEYLRTSHRVGIIAPGNDETSIKYTLEKEVISSGSLIPVEVLKDIGNMRDDFFIDFVDYEWCWRARSKGYKVYSDNSVILSHQTDEPDKVVGKIVSKPFRDYYFYRNSIYLLKNGLMIDSKVMFIYKFIKHTVFEIFFCKNKLKRIKFIISGINDGINGKMN